MKLFIAIFFLLSGLAYGQTNFRAVMVDSNSVVQRPTNFFTTNRILTFDTNGNVVYTNTNALTFTNRPLLKGPNTTNIPALRFDTSDGLGYGSIFTFSRAHATNLWPPEQAQTNWSQMIWGLNVEPTGDGNDRRVVNTNIGSAFWTIENEWKAPVAATSPVSEVYLSTTDRSGKTVRGWGVFASQTNSDFGNVIQNYPLGIDAANLGFFNAQAGLTVQVNNAAGGGTAIFRNSSTNSAANAEIQMISGGGTLLILQKQNRFDLYANNISNGFIIQALTNGTVIGSGSFVSSASAPVHLAGNTHIDGAISFNATSNAATTRTNLGLGGGITTNRTFVSYNGTNYTTNTVTISNGIITGWTQ
jgi:hypothetical protein